MSDIGAMVDVLIASGTPPAVAAQIVAQAFAAGVASADFRGRSVDETADRRREKDRIRKQLERENLRKSADVGGSPQMSENASLSKERKKEENKEERGIARPSVRGQRLPDEWQPTPQDRATAEALIGAERVAAELAKFRDHWKQQPGSKGVKLDWDAAWRNWIRRAAEYGGNRNGHGTGNHRADQAAGQSGSAAIMAGVASAAERRGRERRAGGPEPQRQPPRDADAADRLDFDRGRTSDG